MVTGSIYPDEGVRHSLELEEEWLDASLSAGGRCGDKWTAQAFGRVPGLKPSTQRSRSSRKPGEQIRRLIGQSLGICDILIIPAKIVLVDMFFIPSALCSGRVLYCLQ